MVEDARGEKEGVSELSVAGELVGRDAQAVNEAHRLARSSAESAVQYAVRCGELLSEIKAAGKADGSIPHGKWQEWVEANCDFSCETARKYIQASKKTQNGSALPF